MTILYHTYVSSSAMICNTNSASLSDGRICSACDNGLLLIFDGQNSGDELNRCKVSKVNENITSIATSDTYVAVGYWKKVKVFCVDNPNIASIFDMDFLVNDVSMCQSDGVGWVAVAGYGVTIVNIQTSAKVRISQSHSISKVQFSQFGKLLLLGTLDGHIGLWDTTDMENMTEMSSKAIWTDNLNSGRIADAQFCESDSYIVASTWKSSDPIVYQASEDGLRFTRLSKVHSEQTVHSNPLAHNMILCAIPGMPVIAYASDSKVIFFSLFHMRVLETHQTPANVTGLCLVSNTNEIFVYCIDGQFVRLPTHMYQQHVPTPLHDYLSTCQRKSTSELEIYFVPQKYVFLYHKERNCWITVLSFASSCSVAEIHNDRYLVVSTSCCTRPKQAPSSERIKLIPIDEDDGKFDLLHDQATTLEVLGTGCGCNEPKGPHPMDYASGRLTIQLRERKIDIDISGDIDIEHESPLIRIDRIIPRDTIHIDLSL